MYTCVDTVAIDAPFGESIDVADASSGDETSLLHAVNATTKNVARRILAVTCYPPICVGITPASVPVEMNIRMMRHTVTRSLHAVH